MGPYYRHTSQGMGNFFDMFYEHPSFNGVFCSSHRRCRYLCLA